MYEIISLSNHQYSGNKEIGMKNKALELQPCSPQTAEWTGYDGYSTVL